MPSVRKQYPFDVIEPKWQRYWAEQKTFRASGPSEANFDASKKKLYTLDMFPYPSGAGLHVGHPEGWSATDIFSRYKRMRGFNVLHPMGWDAFGLPAEQYAIDTGTHPAVTTRKNIDTFRRQIQMLGFSYDWDREVDTTDPNYYKWTQWIFLQIHKAGLAYEAEVPVWWCEGCKAVLANEEVKNDGTCERKGHPNVVRRPLRQWNLRITKYAERLLKDLELLNWPEAIKEQQRNWIGRSEGAAVQFKVQGSEFKVEVFTTRPDTLYGATYMVLAPEHPLVQKVTTEAQRTQVEAYRKEAGRKSELERTALEKEKSGVFTGGHAINPVNNEIIPIWIADYVMMGYGTGAIMAVPAHDTRDFEFAKKFGLEVRYVVAETLDSTPGAMDLSKGYSHEVAHAVYNDKDEPMGRTITGRAFIGEGIAFNSGIITGLTTPEAKKKITAWLEERGLGKATVNYRMRDWIFSRQRYWGEPIPIVHCDKCGAVPVPESELPLRLPELQDYSPTSSAEPPLAKATDWVNTKCPKCGAPAKRETNTMPQWAGSCWYYLRFIDPDNSTAFCAKEKEKYWAPVDLYVGGAEHAVLHLLYSRFWHKILYDLGHVSNPEPFQKLMNQGMILGEDSRKMSKSWGNVINPDEVVREYGADAFRLYEMFMGPLEMTKPWSMQGVEGVYRFLGRVWRLFVDEASDRQYQQDVAASTRRADDLSGLKISSEIQNVEPSAEQLKLLHGAIKKVTEDLEAITLNTAISHMMEFVNGTMKLTAAGQPLANTVAEQFVLVLSPFAPHLAEELWRMLGHANTLAYEPWPTWDEKHLRESSVEIVVQVNGKLRDRITVSPDAAEDEVKTKALACEKVKSAIEGRAIKKVIVIPRKLVNVVVG